MKSGEPFCFSKYADGEWMAMCGVGGYPGNGEWIISKDTIPSIQLLIQSFQYNDPGYYVGISCPCCQGQSHYDMVKASGQDDDHLTFANLFVNGNYQFYLDNVIPEFSKRDKIVLVANENSHVIKLPFNVTDFYPVGYNAWVDNLNVIREIQSKKYSDHLILFSCGPLGNILAHQLWSSNKTNTYIDVGSTVDRWLNNDVRNKRCYSTGVSGFSDKICIWGE